MNEEEFRKTALMFKDWFNQEGITNENVWNLDFVIGRFASRYLQLKEK